MWMVDGRFVTYCEVKGFDSRSQVKQFFRTLLMINAVENAQWKNVSTQSVKPFTDYWVPNDSNGSTLYAIEWFKLILRWTSPEMRTVLHMRPNLPACRPNGVLAWSTVSLCWWPPVSSRPTWPCFPNDRDTGSHSKHWGPIYWYWARL